MSEVKQAAHRTGPLKQRNKAHKNGRHKSKGEKAALDKGRVGVKATSSHQRKEARKSDKKNKLRQLRANKRQQAIASKRSVGVEGHPPHLVVLVPVGGDVREVFTVLAGCEGGHTATLLCSETKERFTVVAPPTHNVYSLLDIVKIADTAVLVYDLTSPSDQFNGSFLDALSAQGLPTTLHIAQGGESLKSKALSVAKKALIKNIQSRFPGEKLHLFNEQGRVQLLRTISGQKRRNVFTRDHHSHLIVERSEFIPADGESGCLKVCGYVRGKPLNVNGIVYVPGAGEFLLQQIDGPPDPCLSKAYSSMQVEETHTLLMADPSQQSLCREVVPDPMEGEQTWPTEEELTSAVCEGVKRERQLPEGMSDYQASWIVDSDLSEAESEQEWAEPPVTDESVEGCDSMSVGESMMDDEESDNYDAHFDMDTEQRQLEELRVEREALMFPDEVDTPQDVVARQRFQKYRGLRSFRSSPWDKLENLPRDYARIFQFENFSASRRRVMAALEDTDGALPGWYVTLHIKDFPRSALGSVELSCGPAVVYGLLPHEHKMSVVHFAIKKSLHYTRPLKSKERLVFHCGLRRFTACPIFSQHTPGDKHKFERYLPGRGVCVASVYAPVMYPPQPVLLFKHESDGEAVLVGSGCVLGVDPGRVVVKRIVLSGHPFKINKRSAVIRYMFFDREDIVWFKPVELRTKCGRRGHIKEPLGTHGHMKCVFDGQLKAQDTVLMNLYKRVYPKWNYDENVAMPTRWSLGERQHEEQMN